MTYNMAICDDEKYLLPRLKQELRHTFAKLDRPVTIELFDKSRALAQAVNKKTYHAIFLDIEMPDTNGIEFARRTALSENETCLIFVSGREDMAFRAVGAGMRFVRKKHLREEMAEAVSAVISHFESPAGIKCLDINEGSERMRIPLAHIKYIEGTNKSQSLVCRGRTHTTYSSMHELEKELIDSGFIRIHNSFLVNAKYIYSIQSSTVILDCGKKLPISRYRIEKAKQDFLRIMMQ